MQFFLVLSVEMHLNYSSMFTLRVELLQDATCRKSCNGKGCETRLNLCTLLNPCNGFRHTCINHVYSLKCECDYGYSGTTCEKVQKHSFCARGNGYVRLPSNLLERRFGVTEAIDMSFTLQEPDGQLLWQGDKVNYLSIAVSGGKLEYTYLNQGSKLEIHGNNVLPLNKKHLVSIRRINNTMHMDVNLSNEIKFRNLHLSNFTDKIRTNRVTGDIYLGAVKPELRLNEMVGLDGCIHYISFGEIRVNLMEKQLEEFNVYSPVKPILEPESDYDSNYE